MFLFYVSFLYPQPGTTHSCSISFFSLLRLLAEPYTRFSTSNGTLSLATQTLTLFSSDPVDLDHFFLQRLLRRPILAVKMRYTTATVAAALVGSVSAHTRIYGAWVNGQFQGDGRSTYVRSPPNNDPVKDVTSTDLVCNVNGGTPGSAFVSAAAGDTITMEWYHDNRADDIIASSHKGPITTYVAEYFEDAGAAGIWTKIDEAGYDSAAGTWAVETLIAAGGKWNFTIPSNIKAGKYMIRQEIIALHESDTCYATAGSRGAQFYPSCVQFDITGSGSATPDEAYDFNAGYSCQDPGIQFNLYGSFTSYPIPGPAVESTLGGSGSSGTSSAAAVSPAVVSSAAAATSAAATSAAPTSADPTTFLTLATAAPSAAPTGGASYGTGSSSSGSSSGSSCNKKRRAARAAHRA